MPGGSIGFGGETQEAQIRCFLGDWGRILTAYGCSSRCCDLVLLSLTTGLTQLGPDHVLLCSTGSHRHQKRNSDV